MLNLTYHYKGYDFVYYFRPGKTHSREQNLEILKKLWEFNEKTHKFRYGLFDPKTSTEEKIDIFKDILICLVLLDGRVVGFVYSLILNESYKRPLVQGGLVVITENKGVDLFKILEMKMFHFTYMNLGLFNTVMITTIPKVYEVFYETHSSLWPSPYSDLFHCPLDYKKYLDDMSQKYVARFFPNPFSINKRRFTLILDKRESGFHDRFHSLPMAKRFLINSFCHSWINYEENEDLIVIGKFDLIALLKLHLTFGKIKIWTFLDRIFLLANNYKKK